MYTRATLTMVATIVVLGVVGCASESVRFFKVNSHPRGARIYVNDEPRGETDFERLQVAFDEGTEVTIRVEKDGYQTEGQLIDEKSPRNVVFFLKKAPETDEVLRALDKLQREVDEVSEKLESLESHE